MTTIAQPMPRAGPAEWLLATDHKRTALRTAAAAFVFFGASGVLALLMRSELAQPGLIDPLPTKAAPLRGKVGG